MQLFTSVEVPGPIVRKLYFLRSRFNGLSSFRFRLLHDDPINEKMSQRRMVRIRDKLGHSTILFLVTSEGNGLGQPRTAGHPTSSLSCVVERT